MMTKDEIEKGCKLCASASDYSNCNDCPAYANCVSAAAYNLIIEQEKDIKQLKTKCALLDNELRIARHVLNELKRILPAMSKQYVCAQIDKIIEEQLKK